MQAVATVCTLVDAFVIATQLGSETWRSWHLPITGSTERACCVYVERCVELRVMSGKVFCRCIFRVKNPSANQRTGIVLDIVTVQGSDEVRETGTSLIKSTGPQLPTPACRPTTKCTIHSFLVVATTYDECWAGPAKLLVDLLLPRCKRSPHSLMATMLLP